MRGIGLRAIAALCEQAYDKADVVLLNSYILFCNPQKHLAAES